MQKADDVFMDDLVREIAKSRECCISHCHHPIYIVGTESIGTDPWHAPGEGTLRAVPAVDPSARAIQKNMIIALQRRVSPESTRNLLHDLWVHSQVLVVADEVLESISIWQLDVPGAWWGQ